MDDFTEKLSAILSNPEIMAQIKGLSGALGSSASPPSEKNSANAVPAIASESQKESDNPEKSTANTLTKNSISPEMLTQIMKFAPLLSNFNKDDKYTRFLQSLRPLLSNPRKEKLDNAIKFFKIIRLVPLLKAQGIF